MIQLAHKRDCCGCHACAQACPKGCIYMREDNEGFLYPAVEVASCIDCGLCEIVCPVVNRDEEHEPLAVYAAKNPDDKVRMKSSSGGVFTMLAERTIAEGGVVFGAKFESSWGGVMHAYTEESEGLSAFRGSKYVQSKIGNTYKEAEAFLKQGRKVLFSGTPCQIAGLKRYLRKEYENLLTVDVVCHGVPSPLVWREYIDYKRAKRAVGENTVSLSLKELPVVTGISFRDKSNGWGKYGFKICYTASKAVENSVSKSANTYSTEITPFEKDLFMKGFLKNLYLRPSCYACPAKGGRSGSDITLGDYWGVAQFHPQFADDKGVGLLLVGSEKGADALKEIGANMEASTYQSAIEYNPCIERSVPEPPQRSEFWEKFAQSGVAAIDKVCQSMRPSLFSRLVLKIKIAIWHIIHGR